jgi:uncharacterized protein (TIGR03435 family)
MSLSERKGAYAATYLEFADRLICLPRFEGPGGGAGGAIPTAPEPVGGQTLFEAIEKQLGLMLEKRPRTASVIVIDHIESKPTEN